MNIVLPVPDFSGIREHDLSYIACALRAVRARLKSRISVQSDDCIPPSFYVCREVGSGQFSKVVDDAFAEDILEGVINAEDDAVRACLGDTGAYYFIAAKTGFPLGWEGGYDPVIKHIDRLGMANEVDEIRLQWVEKMLAILPE